MQLVPTLFSCLAVMSARNNRHHEHHKGTTVLRQLRMTKGYNASTLLGIISSLLVIIIITTTITIIITTIIIITIIIVTRKQEENNEQHKHVHVDISRAETYRLSCRMVARVTALHSLIYPNTTPKAQVYNY